MYKYINSDEEIKIGDELKTNELNMYILVEYMLKDIKGFHLYSIHGQDVTLYHFDNKKEFEKDFTVDSDHIATPKNIIKKWGTNCIDCIVNGNETTFYDILYFVDSTNLGKGTQDFIEKLTRI